MNRIPYYLSMLVLSMALVLLLWFFYILFFPIEIIKPNVQPYKILTPVVKVNEGVIYQVDACKLKGLKSTNIRTFVGIVNYVSSTTSNNIAVGCNKTNASLIVPDYIPVGKYYLKIDIFYEVNAFRTVEYNFRTEDFQIIK